MRKPGRLPVEYLPDASFKLFQIELQIAGKHAIRSVTAGACHRQHNTAACPGITASAMDVDGQEPAGKVANSMDNLVRWTAAGGRVTGSKQKQVFVAPDGVHGISITMVLAFQLHIHPCAHRCFRRVPTRSHSKAIGSLTRQV